MSNSLFRRELTGTRLAAGTRVNGHWVEGSPSSISFQASVQPTTAHDLMFLDIGRRERKTYTIYTDFKLNALTAGIANPDLISIDGEQYEVDFEAPWRNNVISHYKYIIVLKQAIEL